MRRSSAPPSRIRSRCIAPDRALTDVGAAAGHLRVAGQHLAVGRRHAEAHVAHGLGLRATAGACHAGDPDADVGPEARAGASASARATSGETAPCEAIISAGTPSSSALASFEYATTPPAT